MPRAPRADLILASVWDTPPASAARVKRRRDVLLRRLVRHAYRRVPYYRELFDRHGVRPEEIRSEADLVRVPTTPKEVLGEPFRMHYEPRSWAILKYLVKGRARLACGVRPGQRIAILDTPSEGSHPSPSRHPWSLHRISALQPPEEIAELREAGKFQVVRSLSASR